MRQKQANERLKQGPNSPYYLKDAYKKYTEALELKVQDKKLRAKLHCNRASINLKFKNYGKVIKDCQDALELNPEYLKAYYRMAKAYIALRKYEECIKLLGGQTDADLVAVRKEAEKLLGKEKQAQSKKEEAVSQADLEV